ncbi:MAG: FtsX-like permease family protein [Chitinophagaceae bacterium]
MSTARSLERAKEVGIRKATGASRLQLIKQFLTEALLVNIVAIIIAVVLTVLLQHGFNQLVNRELSIGMLFSKQTTDTGVTILFVLFSVAGIFLSGFYPAFVLSAYDPMKVLKGKFKRSVSGVFLRKSMVTAQFAISILLIIGSFVVYKQLRYMTGQSLGYNMEQMMILRKPVLSNQGTAFMNTADGFINTIQQLAHVKGAAVSGRIPGDDPGQDQQREQNGYCHKSQGTMANMVWIRVSSTYTR